MRYGSQLASVLSGEIRYLSKSVNSFFISLRAPVDRVSTKISRDKLIPLNTAFEGQPYEGRLKTRESRNAIPIPEDVIPIIEAWRSVSKNTSPDALMFPTFCRGARKGKVVPRQGRNFLKWRIHPIADKLAIPRKLVTFK
jgi:hypothetical protein